MILPVRYYPDPILRRKTDSVDNFTPEYLNSLFQDMIDSMEHYEGMGLASTQVGKVESYFVIKHPELLPDGRIFINPKIVRKEGKITGEEGCLSFPGLWIKVKRPKIVKLRYQNFEGKIIEEEFTGLLARAVCHETDHLNGVVMIDYLSQVQRHLLKKELERISKFYEKSKN